MKRRDFAKLARAAGFWCGEDGGAGHSLLAAYDGDRSRLEQRLADKPRDLSDEEYDFLRREREIKNPAHRPPKVATAEWHNMVALETVMDKLRTGDPDKVVFPRSCERFRVKERALRGWVQGFRKDSAKMAFARAFIERQNEILAEVAELARTDPDGSWDHPVLTIIPAAVPSKS